MFLIDMKYVLQFEKLFFLKYSFLTNKVNCHAKHI